MIKKKILYAISSVGTGNLCRTYAILEEFPLDKYEIRFITQNKAYDYLKEKFITYKLEDLTYTNKEFSFLSILRKNYSFPWKLLKNIKISSHIIDDYKPDVVIVDSDFCSLYPAYRKKLPVISINSSMATVRKFRKFRPSVFSMFFSYYCIEKMDYWLQRKFASQIICPVINKIEYEYNKWHQINPIVRKQFLKVNPSDESLNDIVVMLGGSGIGAHNIDLRGCEKNLFILGHKDGIKIPSHAVCIEYTPEPVEFLSKAKIIIVQGGFNSISEVIAMKKPAIFIPIEGHAEQFVNARWAEEMGIGVMSRPSKVIEAIKKVEDDYKNFYENCLKHNINCNGAIQTVKLIEQFIQDL